MCDGRSLSDDEDEDEEDPGGDEVDELPVRPVKAAPVKRRQSVSAESLDPNKVLAGCMVDAGWGGCGG